MKSGPITQSPELLTALWRGIFFVRWRQQPTAASLTHVNREYFASSHEGAMPLYCGISGDGAGVPDSSLQRKLTEMATQIIRASPAFHLVLEGASTQASLSRSLFRGVITAAKVGGRVFGTETGALVHKVSIHDSLASCLPRLAVNPLVDAAPSVLRAEVERLGFCSD